MATLGAPAGAAAEDGGYDGRHEEHESLAVLAARYGSGSESEGEEGERAQHSGGGGGSEAAQPAPPHGAAQQQQHQPACEAVEALAAEEHGDYDEQRRLPVVSGILDHPSEVLVLLGSDFCH